MFAASHVEVLLEFQNIFFAFHFLQKKFVRNFKAEGGSHLTVHICGWRPTVHMVQTSVLFFLCFFWVPICDDHAYVNTFVRFPSVNSQV
jgi:hypothetical protein